MADCLALPAFSADAVICFIWMIRWMFDIEESDGSLGVICLYPGA
jgi:hypothetical protein